MSAEIQGFDFLINKVNVIKGLLSDNNSDLLPIIRKETYQFLQVLNKGHRGIREIEIVEEYDKDMKELKDKKDSQKD